MKSQEWAALCAFTLILLLILLSAGSTPQPTQSAELEAASDNATVPFTPAPVLEDEPPFENETLVEDNPPIDDNPPVEDEPMTLPQVTISGRDFIVNEAPHMFRGTNIQLTGLHHPESGCQPINAATFDELQTWNVNIIRPWLNMEMASPSYGNWTESFFTNFTLALDLAEARNIYVLPSMCHQYNLSPAFSGTGLPSWMFSGVGSKTAGWIRLYDAVVLNDSSTICTQIRAALQEYYARLVALCEDRNVVMGYDIFNEPQYRTISGYTYINSSYFYEALSDYITDTVKPQCVESNFIDNYYKPDVPNLFTSAHGYATHTFSYTLSQMKSYMTTSTYWAQGARWNVPTWNSEWFLGTTSEAAANGWTAAEIVEWYDTYCRAMEELGYGWQYLRTGTSPSNLHWATGVKAELLSWFALNEPVFLSQYTKAVSSNATLQASVAKSFSGGAELLARQYKSFSGNASLFVPPATEVVPKPFTVGATLEASSSTFTASFSGGASLLSRQLQSFSGGAHLTLGLYQFPAITTAETAVDIFEYETVNKLGILEKIIQTLERQGTSANLTHRQLNLGMQDPVTGWFQKNYAESTVKGIIRPRGASLTKSGFGLIAQYPHTGFLPRESYVRVGDELQDATGYVYSVEAADEEWWLNLFSHYVCNLSRRDLGLRPRMTGMWHLNSDHVRTDARYRQKAWLDANMSASIRKDGPLGCVVALPFEEGAGTTAYDHSGNNNDGTLVNGPNWEDGKYGGGLDFDGSSTYVTLGVPDILSQITLDAASIVDNGVWCWFADPRAVYYNGNTYFGYVTSTGDVMVSKFNHSLKTVSNVVVHASLNVDDHANPALVVRSDGKILVMYSRHGGSAMYYRVSSLPEDISAWEDEEAFGLAIANPHLIRKGSSYFMVIRGTDNRVWVQVTVGGTPYHAYTTNPIAFNEDRHVVATYDGVDIRIYVDGVLASTPVAVGGAISDVSDNLLIGAYLIYGNDGNNFEGFIDEIYVYSDALSAAEVLDAYGGAHPEDNLVLKLPCDEGGGDILYDQSAEGNDATAYNTTVVTGVIGNARDYNGYSSYAQVDHDASLNVDAVTMEAWIHPSYTPAVGPYEGPYTYPHIIQLDNGQTWVLFRGTSGTYYHISEDDGDTWANGVQLFSDVGYFKAETDGTHIFFACTPSHPDFSTTNLFHIYYDSNDETWRTAGGTLIGGVGDLPFTTADMDLLSSKRTWVWDIAVDGSGYPVIVYVQFESVSDHRYRYCRWDGGKWVDHEIADGGCLNVGPESTDQTIEQPSYSGGAVLDHDAPSTVYLSRKVKGKFEVFQYTTDDDGATWNAEQLTTGCGEKAFNMRPVVVRNHAEDLAAIWLYGYYSYYTAYNMMLRTYPEVQVEKTTQTGYTPLTLACWVYPETDASTPPYHRHILRRGLAYGLLMQQTTKKAWAFLEINDVRSHVYGGELHLGSWNHVAFTYDGLYARIYQDGVEVYYKAVTGLITGEAAQTLYVGTYSGATDDNTFDGAIDEVFICNLGLSAEEVELLYGDPAATLTTMFHDSDHFIDRIFLDKGVDGVFSVDKTASQPVRGADVEPYAWDETVPIHCNAVDKPDVSGTNMVEKMEQEVRRIATAYPLGSVRSVDSITHKPTNLGAATLYGCTVTIQYTRANDDYTPT